MIWVSGDLYIMGQQGFWDLERRHAFLEQKQDLLPRLNQIIPWDEFRPILERARRKQSQSVAGRKPYDAVLLFKMLILQQLYNISDEQLEYQIADRYSFGRFLGLGLEDKIPDATTVWLFREQLKKQDLVEDLFYQFDTYLQQHGFAAQGGQILDASLVAVPKQSHTDEEKEHLHRGEIPPEWEKNRHRHSQKEGDARWTKQKGKSHYGYKNHINVDKEYKLIRRYAVSDAAVHDSRKMVNILDFNEQVSRVQRLIELGI